MPEANNSIPESVSQPSTIRELAHDLSNALEIIMQSSFLLGTLDLGENGRQWLHSSMVASKERLRSTGSCARLCAPKLLQTRTNLVDATVRAPDVARLISKLTKDNGRHP